MKLHPIFVHFPVVFFSLAFIFEIIAMFKKNYFANSSLLFLFLALLFSLISVQTGNIEAQALNLTGDAENIFKDHQSSANFFVFLLGFIFMFKVYIFLKRKNTSVLIFLILLVLYVFGLLFVYRTTYLGMKLVFEHGVGVKLN